MKKSNKIIEYSIYSLLSFVLAMLFWWVAFGFIANNYNVNEWEWIARAIMINFSWPAIVAVWIQYHQKN